MIENDMCIRATPVYGDYDGKFVVMRKECVITKEEFLECFNEWVVKPSRENPVSVQTEFYIPADNGGVTPV